eukprot:2948048-Prymnesium_polylepis.2
MSFVYDALMNCWMGSSNRTQDRRAGTGRHRVFTYGSTMSGESAPRAAQTVRPHTQPHGRRAAAAIGGPRLPSMHAESMGMPHLARRVAQDFATTTLSKAARRSRQPRGPSTPL